MHAISFRYVKFLPLYKTFTLSVQCKCANCTSVYKGTYLEGFELLGKIAFSLRFSKGNIGHSDSSIPYVHIHCNVVAHLWWIGTQIGFDLPPFHSAMALESG